MSAVLGWLCLMEAKGARAELSELGYVLDAQGATDDTSD